MPLLPTVPELVSDINLKRARTETVHGDAIKVYSINSASNVSITPTLTSGTKIADYNIDGETGVLYVPPNTGVGQAYPGTIGGEIFNSYEGTEKNEASGNYSTAMGYNNKSQGVFSFCCGNDNKVVGGASTAIGSNNTENSGSGVTENIMIGSFNTMTNFGDERIAIGTNNTVDGPLAIAVGDNLNVGIYSMAVGKYNEPNTALTTASFTIGVGSTNGRKNAIECNDTETKICNNLQLATNSYEVNDITAPISTPASSDDKTLATKAYVDANAGGFTPQRTEIYADHIYLTSEPPIDLGEIPYQKGRVVLRGTLSNSTYSFTYTLPEVTFESYFDLTTSPKKIDEYVQQTSFTYDDNKYVGITLTLKFSINSSNHLIMNLLPSNEMAGVVFYDQNRVAQGTFLDYSGDVQFDTLYSHSYFFNY